MSTYENTSEVQVEQLLEKALILIELTLDLRDKSHIGEKYACDLKSLAWKACQITSAIQQSSRDFLQLAEHIIKSALEMIVKDKRDETSPENAIETIKSISSFEVTDGNDSVNETTGKLKENHRLKEHTELMYKELINLQNILKKDIQFYEKPSEIKLFKTKSSSSIGDMIKTLQTKQQQKRKDLSPRICHDDKYPERASRESLLDQANLSLQTVHEDGFIDFSQRSSHEADKQASGLSMKTIRRIKKYLHNKVDSEKDPDTNYTDDGNIIQIPTRSHSNLDRSCSGSCPDVEYTETVLKTEGSHINVLLHNISEED